MKISCIAFLLLLSLGCSDVYSQLHNGVWMIGYQFDGQNGGIDFTTGNADTFGFYRSLNINSASANMCAKNGKLLFYTNGIYIDNSEHDTLFNSSGFNPGYGTEYSGMQDQGLDYAQSIVILPVYEDTNLYHIFSISYEIVTFPFGWDDNPLSLRYSSIDMTLDSGRGGIVKKAEIVLSDTLSTGRLTATRHANGRDWWVICHEYRSSTYYILLVTKDSIYSPKEQEIGDSLIYDAWGQNCFSPDGSKFVNVDPIYQDSIFDYMEFDRCKGEFFAHQDLHTPGCQPQSGAFSATGRYLYVTCTGHLYQFDTWADDMQSTRQEVGELSVQNNFNLLNNMMLAPDNKIYISTWSAYNFMHVIDYPDSSGLACHFIENGLPLPTYNGLKSVPNAVNYELGAITGSPCDTLGLGIDETTSSFLIQPNPASNWFNIIYQTDKKITARITDAFGREVKRVILFPYFKNQMVDVSKLSTGMYLVTLQEGHIIFSAKMMISR